MVNEKRRLLMGRVWGREKLVLLVKGRNAGGKRVDLEIRKKTRERTMNSVVRCFRDKIMFRKQDLVEKFKEQFQ